MKTILLTAIIILGYAVALTSDGVQSRSCHMAGGEYVDGVCYKD